MFIITIFMLAKRKGTVKCPKTGDSNSLGPASRADGRTPGVQSTGQARARGCRREGGCDTATRVEFTKNFQ